MIRAALKAAARVLVSRIGGLDAAAAGTRVGRSNLADYGSVNQPERFVPADVIADLEAAAGEPLITAVLARAAGFELVRLGGNGGPVDVVGPLSQMAWRAGSALATAIAALADGRIDAGERVMLIEQLSALQGQVRAALAALVAAQEQERGG